MEFVPAPDPLLPIWAQCAYLLLVMVFCIAGGMVGDAEGRARYLRWPLWLGAIGGLAFLLVSWSNDISARGDHADAIASDIEKTYGMTLDDGISGLRYPSEEPEREFQVFGSVEHDFPTAEGFERETVYLIWKNGIFEMAASSDGEKFTSLEVTR